MFRIEIKTRGFPDVIRRLMELRRISSDLTPVFDQVVHEFLLMHMSRRFDSGGSYGGKPWARYGGEPKWQAYKRRVGADPRPLWWKPGQRERLRPSLTSASHPLHVWRAGSRGAYFGTAVEYAPRLERGGINPYGEPSPPRTLVHLEPAQQGKLARAITQNILDRVNKR